MFARETPIRRKPNKLRIFNNFLTAVIVMLALYIMASPYLPALSWWAQHEAPVISKPPATPAAAQETVLDTNSLVIPALGLQEAIHAGPTAAELKKGIWLRPNGSTPDKASNTVLAGHRSTYNGNAVFYHLDKVKVGDAMQVHWNGKRYDYIVREIKIVPPTAIEVENPTPTSTLTVYTCTPVWSAKDRLVLIADLVEES